ncbi:MAG: PfkB family carbohydrate kinase [Actinomycetota bacterium]|nr:PfkB family carbohydrate kinase [Actinomycetota bacterium]
MIIGLGCIAHDRVLATETAWTAGKGRITRRETRWGGNVRNALTTVAALAHPAGYLATLGTSRLSDDAAADLAANGVLLDFVERVEGAEPVSSTLIITVDGERYIAFDDSSLAHTPMPDESFVHDALEAAQILLVDAPTAPPGSCDVVLRARERGIPIVLDAERDPHSDVIALMDAADHLIIPMTFGRELTSLTDPQAVGAALWNDARATVVLTAGAEGSYALESPDDAIHLPAWDVPVIDTTGCGDTFHGAYACALSDAIPLRQRIAYASAAAAVVAGLPPGHDRVPSPSAVDALLTRHRGSA